MPKELFKNVFSIGLIQVVNFLIPVIIFPYLIRKLGISGFGNFTFSQSIGMYIDLVVSFGFSLTAPIEIAKNIDNKDKINQIVSSIVSIKVLLFFTVAITLWVSTFFFEFKKDDLFLILVSLFIPLGNLFLIDWYFQGIQKMNYILILAILSRVIACILIILLVNDINDLYWAVIAFGIGGVISGLLSLFIAQYYFKLQLIKVSLNNIKEHVKSNLWPFASVATVPFYSTINIFIIKVSLGEYALGIYSVADKVVGAFGILNTVFNKPIIPHLAKIYSQNKNIYKKEVDKYAIYILLLSLVIVVNIFMFGENLLKLIVGLEIENIKIQNTMLRIMCLALVVSPLCSYYHQNIIVINKKKYLLIILVIVALVNVSIVHPLLTYFGVIGIAINYCIVNVVLFIVSVSVFKKFSKNLAKK